MPRAADVAFLIGFLQHRRDLGVGIDGLEELVDIDLRKPFRERDVVIWREILIAEEQHAMFSPCVRQLRRGVIVEFSDIDVAHHGANSFRCNQHGATLDLGVCCLVCQHWPVLIKRAVLDQIAADDLDIIFRKWRKPTVKEGGQLRTAVGMLNILAVDKITRAKITAAEARRAGFESKAALVAELDSRDEGDIYRITLEHGGVDPLVALRENANLTATDITELADRLARLDKASKRGPWTTSFLNLLDANPQVRAPDLAEGLGLDKPTFKNDVRKLKGMGLTISFSPGYELSPRGKAYLHTL